MAYKGSAREAARRREQFAKLNERADVFEAQKLCRACGAEAELDHKWCWDHLRYFRQYQRDRRARLKRAALCVECGKRPPDKDNQHCAKCRRRTQVRYRERRKQQGK
ncbi:hypothetical protein LCGC14_2203150 [marine sediment metagenome]|uniref:Uncharacterized protein n=1 Tax=marine sediment metagenome TaxID=412755 RepID=A0A0F9FTG6_9ZZZZ